VRQLRESELESKKSAFVRQINDLRDEVGRLSTAKESLQDVCTTDLSSVEIYYHLQCSDAVGWVAGRASGL